MAFSPSHSTTAVTTNANLSKMQVTVRADTSDPGGDKGHIPPLPRSSRPIR